MTTAKNYIMQICDPPKISTRSTSEGLATPNASRVDALTSTHCIALVKFKKVATLRVR